MNKNDKPQSMADAFAENMSIPCPTCGEPMMMTSGSCPSCKTEFTEEEIKANVASKKTDPASCFIMLAVIGLVGLVLFAVTSSCSSNGNDPSDLSSAPSAGEDYAWKEAAKDVVRAKLRDPESAEFTSMKVYPETDDRATIICGYVNSRNGFGGMTGPQRFIAGGVVMLEEEFTAAQMTIAWTKFCY